MNTLARPPVILGIVLSCLAASTRIQAEVRLPSLFSDHMVLQQDAAAPVWGWASAGEQVTVSIDGQTQTTTAGADGRWLVLPDGFSTGALVSKRDVAQTVRRLMQLFLPRGVIANRGRMAGLAGQPLPAGFDHSAQTAQFAPRPGRHDLGQIVGFEFGQLRAETLAALAVCAIRITPWRMILLEGGHDLPALPEVICDPFDSRLNVTACTGAPGCPQALQPTRNLARALAPLVPAGQGLHVSGCAKGCAHPTAASVTLTGTLAGFDIMRNGRASDPGMPYDPTTPLFKAL